MWVESVRAVRLCVCGAHMWSARTLYTSAGHEAPHTE